MWPHGERNMLAHTPMACTLTSSGETRSLATLMVESGEGCWVGEVLHNLSLIGQGVSISPWIRWAMLKRERSCRHFKICPFGHPGRRDSSNVSAWRGPLELRSSKRRNITRKNVHWSCSWRPNWEPPEEPWKASTGERTGWTFVRLKSMRLPNDRTNSSKGFLDHYLPLSLFCSHTLGVRK